MNLSLLACLAVAGLQGSSFSPPGSGLSVDVSTSRGPAEISARVEEAVKVFSRNAALLTARQRFDLAKRGLYHRQIPFSLPVRVELTGLGSTREGGRGLSAINLVFDATGPRAFPDAYKQLLQDVFAEAQSYMDTVFGPPSEGGDVHVRNFDADIGDRDAVAGGYYLHDNGSGEREIRFPVYAAPEATAVNFVHTLLLAYLGAKDYGYDAFTEGILRAAVMRIARVADALPASMDPEIVEQVLENTYDVGTFYDWWNQRALGGERFIAANLRNVSLPIGGSLGGIYLARYQMGGSAWQKVLAENSGFIAAYNAAFYSNPSLRGDVPGLIALAQTTLDAVTGTPNATLEGWSFAEWFRRQFVLDVNCTLGPKLLVQPVPLPPIGGSNDFGVFLVQATYYETRANGDEILLSGTSYPIFWTANFDRIFPSAQEDVMPISGAYGSVAPNLEDIFGGQPYRASIDIGVHDRTIRTYVPAGGVATGANTTPNDFYGTVIGVPGGTGVTQRVRLTIGATVFDTIPVTNGAFGERIDQQIFLNSARLRVEVIRTVGITDTVVIDRFVNKGPGPLALDLRLDNGEQTFAFTNGLPKGLELLGLPLDPWAKTGGELLGIPESQVLAARYNTARAAYDIYPNTGPFVLGNGFFVRTEVANPTFEVEGKGQPGVPVAVALRPGWNIVSAPIAELIETNRVNIVKAAEFPKPYSEAAGVELGTTFFKFTPGAPDAATGAPETGTLDAATNFEPGKGYFVRVLVPEGVTMMFDPSEFTMATRSVGGGAPPPPDWRLKLRLEDGPHSATALVGTSRTATAGYDTREDSGLPPSLGGMQIVVEGVEAMYQDLRRTGVATRWRIKAQGLVPGRLYRLALTFANGQGSYGFADLAAGAGGVIRQNFYYRFRATAPTRTFEIAKGAN